MYLRWEGVVEGVLIRNSSSIAMKRHAGEGVSSVLHLRTEFM